MRERMEHREILRVGRVRKAFGGISAVDDCSLSVSPQSVTGLIGPNGAGKSTLFNLVAGLYQPDEGEIWFNETRIDGRPPFEIVHLGLTKTWQIPHELRNMTVLENLVLAAKHNAGEHLLNLFVRPGQVHRDEKMWRARAREILKLTQLDALANEHAKGLSGGQKKLQAALSTTSLDAAYGKITLDQNRQAIQDQYSYRMDVKAGALSIVTVQFSPPHRLAGGWSDTSSGGVSHETDGRCPCATSAR